MVAGDKVKMEWIPFDKCAKLDAKEAVKNKMIWIYKEFASSRLCVIVLDDDWL